MTLDEFYKKYSGGTWGYPDGQYVGECLSLAKWYINECFGINPPPSGSNSAYGYWSNFPSPLPAVFEKVTNTPEGVPQRGDIVIWKPTASNSYGHIAIFLEGNTTDFVSFDQNSGGKEAHRQAHTYTNVVGWLHPKENMANELDTCLADRKKFWEERDTLLRELQADSVEGGLNTIRGLRSRITDLTNQLGIAQAEVKNKEEIISRLQATLLQKDDDIKGLDDKLDLATNTVAQLGKDKGNLAIEVEQLKIQVETLKAAQANGEVTLTIADLFKLIWNKKITIKKG